MQKLMPNGANASIDKRRFGPLGMGMFDHRVDPPPDPIPEYTLGPADIYIEDSGLTEMRGPYELASPTMTMGVVCYYSGALQDGEIQATHGGEPLTLVRIDRNHGGVFTAIFYGNNLTREKAELRVFTTSTEAKLGPALMRMRDDLGHANGIKPIWNDGTSIYARKTRDFAPNCTRTGSVLTAFGIDSFQAGGSMAALGNHPELTTGLRGRVLCGDFEDLDNATFKSDYWKQDEPGVFTLTDAGHERSMTLDVQIDPNVRTGLRFDYTAPHELGIYVFYERPNGSFVNMAASRGVDRRWYLPLPPSTTGYVRLRFRANISAQLRNIKLIRNPFGIYGVFSMAQGQHVNDDWQMYGMTLNPERMTMSSFAIDGV